MAEREPEVVVITGASAGVGRAVVSPVRLDNLFEPLPGDYAAHGTFTGRARNFSAQNWMDLHRTGVALAAAGVAGVGALLWRKVA